jgi:hypothetical protein
MPNYRAQYPDIAARFPGVKLDGGGMTPAQGRLVFHQERLLYGRRDVHRRYTLAAHAAGLPDLIETYTRSQCRAALWLLEGIARRYPIIGRNPSTQWEGV